MRTVYDIVHILPDKSEQLIQTVDKKVDIRLFADSAKYKGTWVSDTRKILRYRKGEIRIVERQEPETPNDITIQEAIEQHIKLQEQEDQIPQSYVSRAEIIEVRETIENDVVKIIARTINSEPVYWLEMTVFGIRALGLTKNPLWEVYTFTDLGERIGKNLAYQCLELYEQHFASFGVKGAL